MRTIIRPITWLETVKTGWGNGYVLLPKGHKWHGKHYDDIPVEIHGGLTFSEPITEDMVEGENWEQYLTKEDVGCWMIGFDCAHFGDTPQSCPREFVESETQKLKEQCL